MADLCCKFRTIYGGKEPRRVGIGDRTGPPVPEIIDPVFAKTSPKRSFCITENERFELVFTKTGSINSGTGYIGWQNLSPGIEFLAP
jgi:hypothetical protein